MTVAKTREYCGRIANRTLGTVYACLGRPTQLTGRGYFYSGLSEKWSATMTYRKARAYRNKWAAIVEIYGPNCVYCHNQPATQIDHVIPVSYIDCNRIENLRPACAWCNLLAGSQVFETFDDKYEWLREERYSRRRNKNLRTICTVCRLPYQRPLHSPSLFLCAECNDYEYHTRLASRRVWREWLALLNEARIIVECHREFGRTVRDIFSLTPSEKNEIFGTIYASYLPDEALAEYATVAYQVLPD